MLINNLIINLIFHRLRLCVMPLQTACGNEVWRNNMREKYATDYFEVDIEQ